MTHLGEPCNICGDVGFEEYITTCFQCKIAREHCYCMRKVLLTIPEIWFCEECQSSNSIASTKSVTTEHIPTALTSDAFETKSPSRFFKNQGITGSSPGWSATIGTMPKRSLPGFRDALSMCSVKKARADHDCRTLGHSRLHGYCSAGFSSITQQNAFRTSREFQALNKKTSACTNEQQVALMPIKMIQNSNLLVESIKSTDSKPVDALPIVCSVKPESMAIMESNPLNIGQILVKSFPNYPTSDPTWCGSFEILNSVSSSEFFDGFRAHVPRKVHRKALEFSKQMPGVLLCSMLPGSDVLMDVFDDECPNMEDIALYFFPGSFERSKQQYMRLLDHMEARDLVLKSCINGVELLIFSSTRLHVKLCGSKSNFLWGICRRLRSNMAYPLLPFNDLISQECAQNFDGKTSTVTMYLSKVKTELFDGLDATPKSSKTAVSTYLSKVKTEQFDGLNATPRSSKTVANDTLR